MNWVCALDNPSFFQISQTFKPSRKFWYIAANVEEAKNWLSARTPSTVTNERDELKSMGDRVKYEKTKTVQYAKPVTIADNAALKRANQGADSVPFFFR